MTRLNLIHAKEKHRDTKGKRSYWEMIKLEIRDFCIRFSKWLSKGKKRREMDLLCKLLKQLTVLLDQNPQDTKLTIEAGHERVRLKITKNRLT